MYANIINMKAEIISPNTYNVKKILYQEKLYGLNKLTKYNKFQNKIDKIKHEFFLF